MRRTRTEEPRGKAPLALPAWAQTTKRRATIPPCGEVAERLKAAIFDTPIEELHKTQVVRTVLSGDVIFDAEQIGSAHDTL